jgi:NADPH-ferrihemoprotein reductase
MARPKRFSGDQIHCFSNHAFKTIRILFGSQTGTAQLFAAQLADEVDDLADEVVVSAVDEAGDGPSTVAVSCPDVANIFITSVCGVGEAPENCRNFYDWLHTDEAMIGSDVRYSVFGCGNLVAHPQNYNVIGKYIDQRMTELGAKRLHSLGLGDDSDCIDDDFDQWTAGLLEILSKGPSNGGEDLSDAKKAADKDAEDLPLVPKGSPNPEDRSTTGSCIDSHDTHDTEDVHFREQCVGATSEDERRRFSPLYPRLQLRRIEDGSCDVPRPNVVFDTFQHDAHKLPMVTNRALRATAGEYILHEMIVSIDNRDDLSYETGDHLVIYPRNAQCTTDAYLDVLDVDRSCIVEGILSSTRDGKKEKTYPHPLGLTIEETLMYCIDLGAPPSPSLARKLLGRKDIDYKREVAEPRRTVIELIKESGLPVSLEELLFNLPPMQPRYYSIASSPLVHPNQIYITYRPVKYITSLGTLREGTCSSYMKYLHNITEDSTFTPYLAAKINSNPTFRLPKDDSTPILLVAGGCGVAPIRAFIESRIARAGQVGSNMGPAYLYLGFRSPGDAVYRSFIQKGLDRGAITEAHISYTKGCTSPEEKCQFVSDTLKQKGKFVVDFMENGGHIYLCGGARTFGAAMENVLLESLQEHKSYTFEDVEEYLRQMLREGRLCEDLAD